MPDSSQLLFYLNELTSRSEGHPIETFILVHKESVEELADHLSELERNLLYEKTGPTIYKVDLRLRKRSVQGWLDTRDDIWILHIVEPRSPSAAESIADDWIAGVFPILSSTRVTYPQILDLLDDLAHVGRSLRIQDYVSRSFRWSAGRERWLRQTTKRWLKGAPYDRRTMERNAESSKELIDAIHFYYDAGEESFEAKISRRGRFTYYRGGKNGFLNFRRLVVEPMISAVTQAREIYSNREKHVEREYVTVKPIEYRFSRSLHPDPDFRKISDVLGAQSEYTMSLVHSGNPYLALRLIDRDDGSSYDVYGFEKRLLVVPLDRATSDSLARLDGYINEVFPDGAVSL